MGRIGIRLVAIAFTAIIGSGVHTAAADPVYAQVPVVYLYTADLAPAGGSTAITAGPTDVPGETRFGIANPTTAFFVWSTPAVTVQWRNLGTGAAGTVELQTYWLGTTPIGGGPGYADSAVAATGSGPILVTVATTAGTLLVPGVGVYLAP